MYLPLLTKGINQKPSVEFSGLVPFAAFIVCRNQHYREVDWELYYFTDTSLLPPVVQESHTQKIKALHNS